MDNSGDYRNFFEYLGKILIRSFLMGLVLLIIWQLALGLAPDCMFAAQSQWFCFTPESFNMVNYCGMGILKLVLIVFFLFPYLSIRLVLRSGK